MKVKALVVGLFLGSVPFLLANSNAASKKEEQTELKVANNNANKEQNECGAQADQCKMEAKGKNKECQCPGVAKAPESCCSHQGHQDGMHDGE